MKRLSCRPLADVSPIKGLPAPQCFSRGLATVLCLMLAISLAACGGGGGGGGTTAATLASIAVTPANPSVTTGTTQQFTATGTYSDNSIKNITAAVTWGSSDTSKATINASGLATAVAAGSTTVTATSGSISGTTTLTVTSATTSITLPKTGQTTCYDHVGVAIPCGSTGQDGELLKGVAWPSPRFAIDGTGLCVTDSLTGLMWVRTPDITARTWATAHTYANDLSLCGGDDWRLPNRKELRSLINYGQTDTATWLNTQGFGNVQASGYWSSTTYAFISTEAWYVGMGVGLVLADNKSNTHYVWPVRTGQ